MSQGETSVTLCIGLDIAWFGGSASNPDSQYDCIGSVLLNATPQTELALTRVALTNRDPDAARTLAALRNLVAPNLKDGTRIVLAVDAPVQAVARPHLPVRSPAQEEGASGKIERRACEEWLSEKRKLIDKAAGGCDGWHPNIQAGAPLAERVKKLLAGLATDGFRLWTPEDRDSKTLVIECFPAEAIWAAKCQGGYASAMTAACAKAYKAQARCRLKAEQIGKLVADALNGFATISGNTNLWNQLVQNATNWLLADQTWQCNGFYRGGKLLDDVVDTMICLATALSYVRDGAHAWRNPEHPDDGHIIGPGCPQGVHWSAAHGQEVAP